MSSLDADELFRRLVEHQNFARFCLELVQPPPGKQSVRPMIKGELRQWLSLYESKLPEETFQQLFQMLYVAVLKAVSQFSQSASLPQVDTTLFPEISEADDTLSVQRTGTLSYSLPAVEQSTSQQMPMSEQHTIFPDVPSEVDLSSFVMRSLMRVPATQKPTEPPQTRSPHDVSDTSEVPAIEPEMIEAFGILPSSNWAQEPHRFQIMPFEKGFYLLDRESGAVWLMRAGHNEFEPCYFEQGDMSFHWPPTGKSLGEPKKSALASPEITVSFSSDSSQSIDPSDSVLSADSHPLSESFPVANGMPAEDTSHTIPSSQELPALFAEEERQPTLESLPSSPAVNMSDAPITSDELDAHVMPLSLYGDYPEPNGIVDDDALSVPTLAPGTPPPPSFASQVVEQLPLVHSSEDLSALPPIGAYSEELYPTLLPNRLRPGEGASYDALHGFDPLNQDILDTYPYPIARLYEAFLSENDPRLRLRLLMLVFIHLIKYATFPMVVQYLRHPELHDVSTHQALLRLQSTRWSSWLEFLRASVELFDGTSVPFTEELIEAFRRLETDRPTQEQFLYTQRFLDPLGVERMTHLHLGLLEALVVYRDSFVHGFTPTLDQAQEDLVAYEPLLRTILQEMRFLAKYPLLYTFQRSKDGTYLCYPLMGANPDPSSQVVEIPSLGLPTERPLFLMMPQEPSRSLPLYPLLVSATPRLDDSPIPSQHHAIFLFHGCNGRQMLYHNLWQVPYLTHEQFGFWQDLLQRSMYPQTTSQLTLPHLLRCASQWTERQLEELRFNQHYFPELSITRRALARVASDFFSSRAVGLLLHGTAGIGKTTFLAQQAEEAMGERLPVVWLRGIHIQFADISSVISSVLGIPVRSSYGAQTDRLAQALGPLVSPDRPLVVVFDDLELPHEERSVWDALDRWLAHVAQTPLGDRIKVMLAVGSRVYGRYLGEQAFPESRPHFFSFEDSYLNLRKPSIALEIPPFFADEVELAYKRYWGFQNGHGIAPFRPLTTWTDLPVDASSREVLRHPLLMRIVMATFCQQDMPAMLPLTELFQQYLDQVIEEKYAPLPIPERLQFLRSLLRQFFASNRTVLTRAALLESEEGVLLRALQNAHTDSPLIQLLHLGVLVEEWQAERCYLRFTSPLVFSFFLANEWMEQSPLRDASVMFALTEGELLVSPLSHSYLFMWINLLRSQQSPTLCSWLHENTKKVSGLLEEFLVMLIRTGETSWIPFVEELLIDAPIPVLECLLDVADRLLMTGYEEIAQRLLNLLRASIPHETRGRLDIEVLYRCARLCELQGMRDRAVELYLEVQIQLLEERAHPLLAQSFLRLASLSRQQGSIQEAHQYLDAVQTQMDFSRLPELHARVIRQQGNMAYEQGDFEQALACYQKSLRLDEGCGNLRGIAASLSNLGTVFGSRGELDNASAHYHRCLHIHQQLGDRKNVATTLNNIGIILKNQGKHEPALGHFLRSLSLREELGLFREVVTSHNNIALLYKQLGRLDQAQEHILVNLKLFQRLQDRQGTAHALHLNGELYALQNDFEEASQHYQQAQDYFVEQKDESSEASVLLSKGRLCECKGELEEALGYYRKARGCFETQQAAVELTASLQAIASIYAQREQFEQATNELQQALSLAEQLQLGVDVLDIMIELAHVRLLRHDVPAAQAYTDRAQALSQELDLPTGRKDVAVLLTRLCIREDNWLRLNEHLRSLEAALDGLAFDTTPVRTAWAFFEAAVFCRDLDQIRSLELCQRAYDSLQNRFFSKSRELENLLEELTQAAGMA